MVFSVFGPLIVGLRNSKLELGRRVEIVTTKRLYLKCSQLRAWAALSLSAHDFSLASKPPTRAEVCLVAFASIGLSKDHGPRLYTPILGTTTKLLLEGGKVNVPLGREMRFQDYKCSFGDSSVKVNDGECSFLEHTNSVVGSENIWSCKMFVFERSWKNEFKSNMCFRLL